MIDRVIELCMIILMICGTVTVVVMTIALVWHLL